MRLSLFFLAVVVAPLTLAGCSPRQTSRPPVTPSVECVVIPAPSRPPRTVTIALMEPVDPSYAPWARNSSEQLLFYQLYETLITRDCTGQVQPGLAETWKRQDGGRRWTFVLRDGALFSDGSRVTAQDVVDSWQRAAVEPLTLYAEVDHAQPDGERVLEVYFKRPQQEVPLALSSNALAVTKPSGGGWPLGTGRYQMDGDAMTARAEGGGDVPVLKFVNASAYEPRDLFEGRVDLMVTRDPSIVDYADNNDQLQAVALPWDVTYVLLSASRATALAAGQDLPSIDPGVLENLARDAVRVEARGSVRDPWWSELGGCGDTRAAFADWTPGIDSRIERRVVYDVSDPIARDLARRIVSLSGMSPSASAEADAFAAAVPTFSLGSRLTVSGLSDGELATRLWGGQDFAYVIAVPHRPSDGCYAGLQLIHRAPWLTMADGRLSDLILPLVDSRRHVVARQQSAGISVDWFGNVFVFGGSQR